MNRKLIVIMVSLAVFFAFLTNAGAGVSGGSKEKAIKKAISDCSKYLSKICTP
jgi:hypothetical protein